jgi:hypothetical protein
MQAGNQDKWLTSPVAAKRLGVTERTLLDLGIERLEVKRGGRVLRRYRESVITAFEQKHTVAA